MTTNDDDQLDAAFHVYVIARTVDDGVASPVKVGITSNIPARIKAIQTTCPHPIELVYAVGVQSRLVALGLESSFHLANAERQVSGEWFDMEPLRAARWLVLEFALGFHPYHSFGPASLRRLAPDRGTDLAPQIIATLDRA